MPNATVIDQLIIKLGLDPRDFTKGEKQVAADVLQTEQKVKKSADGMGRSITGLATKWLTVAAAVAAVKKVVSIIDDAAERTRRLGIDAKNYDTAADKLRNFENAVVMMGGNAEQARQTVAGLQKSIFDLAYNGQVSDSLVMLTRLGVQFQTATGEARDFNDIILDTADAIGKAQANGMSRASAFQFLQQSGFDGGTAQLILSGRANIEKEQATQKGRYQVTPGALQGAEKTARGSIDLDQQTEALKVKGLEVGAGSAQTFVRDLIAHPSQALDKLSTAAEHAGTWLENIALKASGTTRGLRNNNPGNLKAVGGQRRDREGFAVYATLEEGIRANDRQIKMYEARGLTTARQIVNRWAPKADNNDVAAYLKDIEKSTGIKPDEDVRGLEPLLESGMFRRESGSQSPGVQDIADILTMQDDTAPTPGTQGASAAYNKTDVHIDGITVNTQATDAEGMADDLDGALSRKLMASHAEPGMQ